MLCWQLCGPSRFTTQGTGPSKSFLRSALDGIPIPPPRVDSSKGQKNCFYWGAAAPQTPWRGAGSPRRPPAYREAPPLVLSVFSWYRDYWTCPNPCDKDFRILTCPNPCDKDFRILDLSKPLRQRFQNFGPVQTLATKISEFWTSGFPGSQISQIWPGSGRAWALGQAQMLSFRGHAPIQSPTPACTRSDFQYSVNC